MPAQIPQGSGRVAPLVLLASKSPRRRQLLTEFGIPHRCAEPAIDDAQLWPGKVPPSQWVTSLANLKAWACLQQYRSASSNPEDLPAAVLGADTACTKQGVLLGTPNDAAEAEKIIRFLSGGSHQAITGVALLWADGRRDLWSDRATVHVGTLTDAQINAYIESGLWHGKAGAYNLRERIDAGWPISFEGDPTTIMGLPMGRLATELRARGIGSAS